MLPIGSNCIAGWRAESLQEDTQDVQVAIEFLGSEKTLLGNKRPVTKMPPGEIAVAEFLSLSLHFSSLTLLGPNSLLLMRGQVTQDSVGQKERKLV